MKDLRKTRLSLPIARLGDSYEIVVIGSGYGGGIAASRLARAGRRVCVLERGKELRPGEYPNTPQELMKQVQSDLPVAHHGPPTGLFDIRYNPDVNVILGCGLGGTSLINAGILLRPDPRIFQDASWPAEIRADRQMDRYFGHAEAMLKPTTYPEDRQRPAKLEAFEHCARSMNAAFRRVPVAINFTRLADDLNHAGVEQHPCVECGDCGSGCNYGAKNTVLMNYLPDAARHGAEIFTEITVRQLERRGERWLVHCLSLRDNRTVVVSADIVVLAAGTLGSTEILLRSAQKGLALSDRLGSRFSANGDTVGFAYNGERPIRGVGLGSRSPDEETLVGPCSTAFIDLREGRDLEDGMIIEDATIPGAVALFLPALLAATAKLSGTDTDAGLRDELAENANILKSKLLGPYTGAIENTLFCLVVSQDDAGGRMYLEKDRLRIRWPGLGKQKPFARAAEDLLRATAALGGTFVPNPVWNEFTDHNIVTGHPLGGCPMADDAAHGVVNHKGQVYDGASGSSVHRGLYVMDGAVVPRSLGVNPLFTISALAERSCEHLIRDQGWTVPAAPAG